MESETDKNLRSLLDDQLEAYASGDADAFIQAGQKLVDEMHWRNDAESTPEAKHESPNFTPEDEVRFALLVQKNVMQQGIQSALDRANHQLLQKHVELQRHRARP